MCLVLIKSSYLSLSCPGADDCCHVTTTIRRITGGRFIKTMISIRPLKRGIEIKRRDMVLEPNPQAAKAHVPIIQKIGTTNEKFGRRCSPDPS
jgi:hypothetical protein